MFSPHPWSYSEHQYCSNGDFRDMLLLHPSVPNMTTGYIDVVPVDVDVDAVESSCFDLDNNCHCYCLLFRRHAVGTRTLHLLRRRRLLLVAADIDDDDDSSYYMDDVDD